MKGSVLSWLESDEVPTTLVGNLDECVASHVLYPFVSLVHKLEELVDNSLQKLPVCLQESWVLADNVHDITGNHSLVVFASLHLSKTKRSLMTVTKKRFSVSSFMAPEMEPIAQHRVLQFAHDHSVPSTWRRQLFRHDLLSIIDIQMSKKTRHSRVDL